MPVRGKSINLFLMDGTAVGRIKCTLANWTGVAYKIPRTELDKCKEREDLKQSGVYFYLGHLMKQEKILSTLVKQGQEKMVRVCFIGCRNIKEMIAKIIGQKQLFLLLQTILSGQLK